MIQMSKYDLKLVAIVGHFGFGLNLLNGQTIKTKIVTDALKDRIGNDNIITFDTHGGLKAYAKLPFRLWSALKQSRNIVFFPAHNGLKVIAPMLLLFNRVFHRRLHYVVIGGWLPQMCRKTMWLSNTLKKLDHIYVETNTMKKRLADIGFNNIIVMPNFKKLIPLTEEQLVYQYSEPYKLCTFSRVMKEKGIGDAIDSVTFVNNYYGRTVYCLDIYGQIEAGQEAWFDAQRSKFSHYINYCGIVPFDQSVDVLRQYHALLFPTHFFTEGIPGTILDSYAAGVPVICPRWENFNDIVEDGKTGIGYDFGSNEELKNVLLENIGSDRVNRMKKNCLKMANNYMPSKIVDLIALE